MMKCEIIRDLIPLYLDKVCSEDSRKLVEEHLAECRKAVVTGRSGAYEGNRQEKYRR